MTFSVSQIRKKFLDYFISQGHKYIHSSPLLPYNDPSMMFINSGMVQFKNIFTGLEETNYNKATSCQKCVRAGGKHNDLENVGYTSRHHTFFEMLGNFSFGDYFKEEAIFYAWQFLTEIIQLPKEKLYITVYHDDIEALNIWKKISGFSDDKIIKISTNDNFWSMGDTGPCGPCSEIFYDHGSHIPGGLPGTPDEDGDRFVEIWNMVFMQFDQIHQKTRRDLPKKSIDTGMGLERISAVLQGVSDNYEIDTFRELISASSEFTGAKNNEENKFSHRVIADHLRSSAFLIADGIMPSNDGRGYVLRRIMRRAMRHANMLGSKEPLLYKMLPILTEQMKEAYPELERAKEFVSQVLKSEEERFSTTLDRGLKLLNEKTQNIPDSGVLEGEIAFKLYDTYGFPLDLTEDILKKRNIKIDHKKFDEYMARQREIARKSWSGSGEDKIGEVWFDIKEKYGPTEFLGYKYEKADAVALALVKDKIEVQKVAENENFYLVANQTPFYGESGGQLGDKGKIYSDSVEIDVLDTKKYFNNLIVHVCVVTKGTLKNNEPLTFEIDKEYRNGLRRNHTATHLLHMSLRKVLGQHATQKGSLVMHDGLRFDVSHPGKITTEQLLEIENIVNNIILENSAVTAQIMDSDQAIKKGALALFGEKYDSKVRVISIKSNTADDHNNINNGEYHTKDKYNTNINQDDSIIHSMELCGGTHVHRTGDIGLFKIISESAIAAGIRRIEAKTGPQIIEIFNNLAYKFDYASELLKTGRNSVLSKIEQIIEKNKELEQEIYNLKLREISTTKEEVEKNSINLEKNNKNIGKILIKFFNSADPKLLRNSIEDLSKNYEDGIFVFISNNNGKVSIIVSCGKNIQRECPADDIVKFVCKILGGKGGGGNSALAQAGAKMDKKVKLDKETLEQDLINYFK